MEYKKLSNIAKLVGGFSFKSSNYVDEGLRVIRIANVQDGYISDESPCFYPMDATKEIGDALLESEDLLMSLTGNVGRVAFINKELLPAGLNQRVECIRPYDSELKQYLYYFFLSNRFKSDAVKNASGSAQLNMSTVWLGNYPIPMHSKEKQKEIVLILSTLQSAIKDSKAQLQLLDELVKSRFIEMFDGSPTISVEDVCESFKIGPFGSALHKNEISNSGYAFVLGTDNAVRNEFAIDEIRYINEEKYHQLENYVAKPGEIIMSMMGTVGRVSIVPETLGRAIISSHLCILRANKTIMLPKFFHLAFCKDEDIQCQIEGIHNGSIMKGFNLKIVKAFKIKCPPLNKQKEFITFAELIDKSKFKVQKRIESLTELLNKKTDEFFGGDD